MSEQKRDLYEFGPFVLDIPRHLLLRDGKPVALTPKTFDLLLVLVENHGRMLTKQELMKTLWPESFVEESNLTQQISMIRKALGETAGEPRFVVTVPAKGYRFTDDVKAHHSAEVAEPPTAEVVPPVAQVPDLRAGQVGDLSHGMGRTKVLVAVLCLAIVGAAAWAIRTRVLRTSYRPAPRSLAILPFQNLKKDGDSDYLGFSLADAVITKLGAVQSLSVRPSSAVERYRHQSIDIRATAEELHTDTLLTGNFIRDGSDLRITSQLIDVKTQNILWRGSFDLKFEKLLTVQDNVARQIVNGLQLSLTPSEAESLKPERPIDPVAYEYYLRGVDLYSRNEYSTAIQMLRKSAEIDSSYALTWAHLGRSLTANASFELGGRDEYKEAQAAYEKALSLQPSQVDTRVYMANLLTDTGQVEQAVPLLRDAVKTNDSHAEVHWELGYAYRFSGMLKESLAECERARALDPGVKLYSSALNSYLYLGQYEQFLQSLPKNSDSALIVFYRGFGEYHLKRMEAAAQHFDDAFELRPTLLQARIGKALSSGIRKQNGKGIEVLRDTERRIAELGVGDPEALYKVAEAYAVLGDKTSALRALKASIENGFFSYPYFISDPLLESLRNDGEFARLMALANQRHQAFRQKFF